MNEVRTDETVYWDRYSDALHDVVVALNTMRNRMAWISEKTDSFKLQRGSDRRASTVQVVRDELRDVCNRNYRDAVDALSKLDAMVGMEMDAETIKRMEEGNG